MAQRQFYCPKASSTLRIRITPAIPSFSVLGQCVPTYPLCPWFDLLGNVYTCRGRKRWFTCAFFAASGLLLLCCFSVSRELLLYSSIPTWCSSSAATRPAALATLFIMMGNRISHVLVRDKKDILLLDEATKYYTSVALPAANVMLTEKSPYAMLNLDE